MIFSGRNEVVAKVIFLHLPVIHSVHRGVGVCLSAFWDTTPPPGPARPHPPGTRQTPPGTRQTPPGPGRHPPDQADTPQDQVDTSRDQADTPPDQADSPPRDQADPREADSSIRSTSGRYASYWNAFLFMTVESTNLSPIC